jgi:serine/threonine-protein kinase
VHRDVKPANLLLDSRDHVHVGDFGIASAVGLDSFTETGTIMGTAGYLSPEQARGERATAASDRYSLAVVAFELLAGERPFASSSTTVEAARHATEPVPAIHAIKPELPPTLDRVFQRALAKAPARRYPSAAEFVAELRAAVHRDAGDTGWILPMRTEPTAITRVAPTRAAMSHPVPRTARRRGSKRWLAPLLLVVLLAAGVAAALAVTRSDPPQHPAAGSRRKPVTVVRTVTAPGRTVEQTVTAPAPPPVTTAATAPAPPTTAATPTGLTGTALNDQGYAKMRAGDYQGALPLLDQAVQQLSGTGSLAEAYADYNLAYTRYELGQCADVLTLLDHSQLIQGHRTEIDALRRDAHKACG